MPQRASRIASRRWIGASCRHRRACRDPASGNAGANFRCAYRGRRLGRSSYCPATASTTVISAAVGELSVCTAVRAPCASGDRSIGAQAVTSLDGPPYICSVSGVRSAPTTGNVPLRAFTREAIQRLVLVVRAKADRQKSTSISRGDNWHSHRCVPPFLRTNTSTIPSTWPPRRRPEDTP